MGILQKIFDARVESLSNGVDQLPDAETFKEAAETFKQQPVTALKALFDGLTCEATALTAKLVKKPLNTSKTDMSGLFF